MSAPARRLRAIHGAWRVALLPPAAFAVHQLRYEIAYGAGARLELARTGHSYLHSVVPWLVAAAAIAAGCLLVMLGDALRGHTSPRRFTTSLTGLWLGCTAALIAIFACQELLEGIASAGHPAGWAGVFGYGGWWAIPVAACVGLVLATVLHGARWIVRAIERGRVRSSRRRGPVPAISWPAATVIAADAPLLPGCGSRGPPLPAETDRHPSRRNQQMHTHTSLRRVTGVVAGLLGAGALVAGCGSSSGLSSVRDASATNSAATTNAAAPSATGSMADMKMSGSGKAVDGITPIPTQTLGNGDWQNMDIKAMAMTAVPFVIYNGTNEREVKPTKRTSFHLMVDLTDARSHFQIPYASVWATIRKQGKVVFDERQWPMISEYMGSHYGNNVTLPGAGHYELSLLVSPPVSARHVEYKNVWLKPHRVNFSFNWKSGA